MDGVYLFQKNPIQDYFMTLMMNGADLSDESMIDDVYDTTAHILQHMGVEDEDLEYLDFNVKRVKGNYYKIVPNNIVCALWLSFKFPFNIYHAYDTNTVKFDDIEYKFNNKTKKLTWKKIEN